MSILQHQISLVMMAKCPVPGRVKTRLQPVFSPESAAAIHKSMLFCVLERLVNAAAAYPVEFLLALDVQNADEAVAAWQSSASTPIPAPWQAVPQGQGALGDRMAFVAQSIHDRSGFDRPPAIAFFGVDSPDLPIEVLSAMFRSLSGGMTGDGYHAPTRPWAGIGPVEDGGYWTLATGTWHDSLVAGIDWGTSSVYHQTKEAIRDANYAYVEWPSWFDVDHPEDLVALRCRLQAAQEPALLKLAEQLNYICKDVDL